MKSVLLFVLVVFFVFGSIQGKEKTVASTWTTVPITIDAASTDWANTESFLDDVAKVEVRFQNDGKNLFVLFLFHDRQTMSTFMQTGLSVWINSDGKHKKNQGILFQGRQVQAPVMIAYLEQQRGAPLDESEKNRLMAEKAHLIQQCSFLGKEHIPFPPNHAASPKFASGLISGKAGMELLIPLNFAEALPAGTTISGLEAGKAIAVGFEWGGATKKMQGDALFNQTNSREMSQQRSTSNYELTQGNEADGRRASGTDSAWDSAEYGMRRPSGPKVWSFWLQLTLAAGQ